MEPFIDSVVYVIPQAGGLLTEWATLLSAIAAIASVIIACVALWLTRKQIRMHEQHNRLMSTPHLSGWNHADCETGTYSFTLENTGLGPAIIKDILLKVDGQQMEGESAELVEAASDKLFPNIDKRDQYEMFVKGEFIPPSKKFEIYRIVTSQLHPDDITQQVQSRTHLVIRYESILGERYVYDSASD